VRDVIPQGTPAVGARHGHEPNSIRVRGIVLFTAGLVATITVVQVVLGLVMRRTAHQEVRQEALPPGWLAIDVDQFPAPRLQKDPAVDLARMREEERRRIDAYGWVDRETGIAFIPVERAMDILAQRGLPKVPAPAPVEGAPPNTFIPAATKREEPGQATRLPPAAKKGGKP
jgi:hypothetical protein